MTLKYNLEEMYQVLRGASQVDGARYDVVEKWFRRCGIIDGIYIKCDFFEHSYLRLCPNKEALGLVQFIQLIGIFCRETKRDVDIFLTKFESVKREIIQEIREGTVGKNYAYS